MISSKIILNKPFMSMLALLFGYSFWMMHSKYQTTAITLEVPVCFYGQKKSVEISSPPSITAIIKGRRSDLHSFDAFDTAAHINVEKLSAGSHTVAIKKENLFLPNHIKLLQLIPSHITILLIEKSTL